MKTILAGLVALAGLFVVFAEPSDAANKKRYRSADSYSERYPYATPRQRQNARAYERGGEYYEQDSNAHPVGSRSWWELKERGGMGLRQISFGWAATGAIAAHMAGPGNEWRIVSVRDFLSDDGWRGLALLALQREREWPAMTVARSFGLMAKAAMLAMLAFALIGPLANLVLWSIAERWYAPHKLPVTYGLRYWEIVFRPTGDAMGALMTSVGIAVAVVVVALAVSVPAGYALARLRLPFRTAIMIAFLLPQAFPSIVIYMNVARVFYGLGLAGTIAGVVLVHSAHALVYTVWITTAAFAAVDRDLEHAARNIGASAWRAFWTVTLPLAAPGIMASAIFVFLESLDEFTGTFFVGVPQVTTLPLLLFNASMGGNYQIASITALILLVPSVLFMLVIERFLHADVLAKVGR